MQDQGTNAPRNCTGVNRVAGESTAFGTAAQSSAGNRSHTPILERALANTFAPLCFAAAGLILAAVMFIWPATVAHAGVDDLAVVDYQYVSRRRAGRTFYDYTYTITVANSAEALQNVVATATSTSPNTTILNGVVPIGDIGAGLSVQSIEFFTFRQNRRFLFDPNSVVWTFTADPAGPTNAAPVADAGPDQVVVSGAAVTLNGGASTDADGDTITYAWMLQSVPPGSAATLDDPTSVMPMFFADVPGDYTAQLIVNDGQEDSLADTVVISTINTPPVADAGLDQTAPVGATVIVFGGGSNDANNDPLTYAWTLTSAPAGSSAALTSLVDIQTTFVIDVAGEYVIQLVVNDGYDDSAPDTVTIATENSPPVADAGLDQTVDVGDTVDLDGTFSFDVDDDPLTYLWSLISSPDGSAAAILDAVSATTQFIADLEGIYVAQLTVNDGTADSLPDTAMITAIVGNQAPTAVATADRTDVAPGAFIQLDGSASTDPEDDALTYLWALMAPAGSNAALSSTTDESPTFTADVEGSYFVTLVVNDGDLDSATAGVTVTASPDNSPPELATIGNRVMFLGDTLNFRLFGIDPDVGDTLTYSLPTQPANMGVNGSTGDVSFTPIAAQLGMNNVTAQVEDSGGLTDSQNFMVEVREAIVAPPENTPPTLAPIDNVTIVAGSTLNVQAIAGDPDTGDTLTYTLPLAPTGMAINATGALQWAAQIADVGLHDVTVQVADNLGAVALQSFIVTVIPVNRAPIAVDDLYNARIGETTSIAAPGVLINDSDSDNDPLTAALVSTTSNGVLDFRADGSFDYTPNVTETNANVELELQCEFEATNFVRGPGQTNGTVTAGDVDNDGDIEIVGIAFNTSAGLPELWVMNGADCSFDLTESPDVVSAGGFSAGTHLGLLDIDGDGDLEVIGTRERLPVSEGGFFDRQHLLAVHHDGTIAWPGNGATEDVPFLPALTALGSGGPFRLSGPTFADIDADGTSEIIMSWRIQAGFGSSQNGLTAFNAEDGSIQWNYQGEITSGDNLYKPPVIADLDLDGTMEIIFDNEVVDHTGAREFLLPVQSSGTSYLFTAVANFDGDPQAEVLARDRLNHYLYNHDGSLIWQRPQLNISESQLTVADFDNDGELEFAYLTTISNVPAAIPGFMIAWETDGETLLWSHEVDTALQIPSFSRQRGPSATAFDVNEDGSSDLVIHLDMGATPESGVYIFDGRDGTVMEFVDIFAAGNVGDEQRFVTIADVDNDGEAEVISSFNGGAGNTRIWQGTSENPLPAAPALRNQWVFSEAIVGENSNIITNPTPHWLQPAKNGFNLISRQPDPLSGTVDSFTYVANDGLLDSNTATVSFDVQPQGLAPIFLTEPDTLTTIGFDYEYAPRVFDPDPGDSVSFTLTAAPAGMTMDSNGRLTWTPDTEGIFGVSIVASDTIGYATPQQFTVTVGEPVVVPDVVGETQADAEAALTGANLLTGRVISSSHPTIAAGSVFNQTPIAGAVTEFGGSVNISVSTGPAPEDVDDDGDGFSESMGDCNDDDDSIGPGNADPAGDGIDQDCDGIDGNLELSEIVVTPGLSTVLIGQSVSLTATGVFVDGTSQNLSGVVTWTNGPSFNSVSPGQFTATASRDGIDGSATIDVVDRVPDDQLPPVVTITAPSNNSTVTEPIDVTGTATDANFLKYELAYAVAGDSNFTTIVESTSPVTDGVLGQFDPTLLLNDIYTIRLSVFDSGGNQIVDETIVQVEGGMKVGNFSLSFRDLSLPLAGIPIEVNRMYDSRDKRPSDFGVGWQMSVKTLDINCTNPLGEGWSVSRSGLVFLLQQTREHKCIIRLPNGKLEIFDFLPNTSVSPFVPFTLISGSFQPGPNTQGTLVSLDNTFLTVLGAQPGEVQLLDDSTFDVLAPERFAYTSADGSITIISTETGVERFTDPNGNSLSIDSSGISHSSGANVLFSRDDLGRIGNLNDPAGGNQVYAYSTNGDLHSHTDAAGNTTRFFYDLNHNLIRIEDPLGRPVLRNEYDEDGRMTATTDAEGNRSTISYDLDGRVRTTIDPLGNATVVEYDENGNIVRGVNPDGNASTFTYDEFNRPLSTIDAEGNTTSFTYDERGNQATVTTPTGETYTTEYDDSDRVVSLLNPAGDLRLFEYDSRGNLTRVIDENGADRRYTYNDLGLRTSFTDESGITSTYEYDALGRNTIVRNANGSEQIFSYDPNGNLVSNTRMRTLQDGSTENITRVTNYDLANNIVSVSDQLGFSAEIAERESGLATRLTDSLGFESQLVYNNSGNLERFVFGSGGESTSTFDARGLQTSTTSRIGGVTQTSYNASGQVEERQYPGGGVELFSYDRAGRTTGFTNERGFDYSVSLDEAGRVLAIIDPAAGETQTTYDEMGRPQSTTDALGRVTAREFDGLGRVTAVELANGARFVNEFEPNGRLAATEDPYGNRHTITRNAIGQPSAILDPSGNQTTLQYDEVGNLLSLTDAGGSESKFAYDGGNNMTSRTRQLGASENWAYDIASRVTRYENAKGEAVDYSYDTNGRLARVDLPDGTFESYTYNLAGQLATVETLRGTTTSVYDTSGRISSEVSPSGAETQYSYDVSGNLIELVTPEGATSYGYDSRGLVTSVTDPQGNETTFDYDAVGNIVEIEFPNGLTETRRYSPLNQLASYEVFDGATILDSRVYTYDFGGRLQSVVEGTGRTVRYTYDAMLQLLTEQIDDGTNTDVIRYSYDEIGNRLTKESSDGLITYEYDDENRLLSDSEFDYSYDPDGNLIQRASENRRELFTYDALNRLVQVDVEEGGNVTTDRYFYQRGLRIEKSTNGQLTEYLYNKTSQLPQILVDLSQNGDVQVAHRVGPMRYGQRTGTSDSYFHTDAQNSVRRISSASGSIENAIDYDAFGEVSNGSINDEFEYRYAGERIDSLTGFYHLTVREYVPSLGRFIQRDAADANLSRPLSANGYLYVENDPLHGSDPLGLHTLSSTQVAMAITTTLVALNAIGIESGVHPFFLGADANSELSSDFSGNWVQMVSGVDVGSSALSASLRTLISRAWGQPVALRHQQISIGLNIVDFTASNSASVAREVANMMNHPGILALDPTWSRYARKKILEDVFSKNQKIDSKLLPTSVGVSFGLGGVFGAFEKGDLSWLSVGLSVSDSTGGFGAGFGAEIGVNCPGSPEIFGNATSYGLSISASLGAGDDQSTPVTATATWSWPTDHDVKGWCD